MNFGTDIEFLPRDFLDFKNILAVTRVFNGIAEFGIFLETTEQNEHFRTTVRKFGAFLSHYSKVDFWPRSQKNPAGTKSIPGGF